MGGIYFLVPTLFTIAISLLIVRGGAIALMMTGMSFNKAKFQALSAFSGTGFTTREAERVVNNVRRRKIISWLMVMGNAGIVTVIVTATSSFSKVKGMEVGLNVLILLVGLGLIVTITMHTPLVRFWEVFAQKRLARLKVFDEDTTIDELLHIAEGYVVWCVFKYWKTRRLLGKLFQKLMQVLNTYLFWGLNVAKSGYLHHVQLGSRKKMIIW